MLKKKYLNNFGKFLLRYKNRGHLRTYIKHFIWSSRYVIKRLSDLRCQAASLVLSIYDSRVNGYSLIASGRTLGG